MVSSPIGWICAGRGIIDRVKRVRFGVAAIVGDFRSDRNSFFRLLIFVSAYERIYVKVENGLMQGPTRFQWLFDRSVAKTSASVSRCPRVDPMDPMTKRLSNALSP